MRKMSLISFTFFTIVGLLCSTSQALTGGDSSGAGDGNYVGGELVLRDFMRTNRVDVIESNESFIKGYPEFAALIKDLADADPVFALSVWNDINQAKLWTTNSPLPLLPIAATAIVAGQADVQIAIRSHDDIIISLPALSQAQDREYVFLHEALHHLMERDSNAPFHHEKLRSLVRYLKENRGHYDSSKMANIFNKYGVWAYWHDTTLLNHGFIGIDQEQYQDGDLTDTQYKEWALAVALVKEQGRFSDRCAILNDYTSTNGRLIWNQWAGYGACGDFHALGQFYKIWPKLNAPKYERMDAIDFGPHDQTSPTGWRSYVNDERNIALCRLYAKPSFEASYARFSRFLNDAPREIARAKATAATEPDVVKSVILHDQVSIAEEGIRIDKELIKSGLEKFHKNVEGCSWHYSNYFGR